MYHEGGRVDTDTPEMAAARGQIAAIQRQHRVQRRHGEQPSQTPTMSDLLRPQQQSDAARSGRTSRFSFLLQTTSTSGLFHLSCPSWNR
jgi:hypothetical protein